MYSATENIKKHVTLLSFRFGIAFTRGKDLILSTCKANPVLPGGAKTAEVRH